jgi:hypothetical protein
MIRLPKGFQALPFKCPTEMPPQTFFFSTKFYQLVFVAWEAYLLPILRVTACAFMTTTLSLLPMHPSWLCHAQE